MVHGKGGFLGRDLSTYGATLSPKEIRSNILRASDNTSQANKMALITMRDAPKFTGIIRNADNFSIQLQSLDGAFHFLNRSGIAKLDFQPGPIMPGDYAATLKPEELNDLVSFLIAAAKSSGSSERASGKDNE